MRELLNFCIFLCTGGNIDIVTTGLSGIYSHVIQVQVNGADYNEYKTVVEISRFNPDTTVVTASGNNNLINSLVS